MAGVGAAVTARAQRDPDPHGRGLRAMVEHAFDLPREEASRVQALVLALVEAAGQCPPLLDATRAANAAQVEAAVAEGVPAGVALLVHHALDGYWLASALGTASEDRSALRDELVALTRRKS